MKRIFLVLSIVILLFSPKQVMAAEVVEISQLTPNSIYAYQRVSFYAWVRSAEIMSGKTGSRNLHLILGVNDFELDAFISPVPITGKIIGYPVIVTGKYMPRGRFGGLLQQDFLIIDILTKNFELLKKGGKPISENK